MRKKPSKRGGMLARTSAAELVVQVESLLTPGCYISCTRLELLLGGGAKDCKYSTGAAHSSL